MTEKQLICREDLLAEYDRQHEGEPGKARKLIAEAPAVDAVEVVHGRWEPHMEKMEDGFGKAEQIQTGLICSECGDYSCCGGNYCKNCGAKMGGDGDG